MPQLAACVQINKKKGKGMIKGCCIPGSKPHGSRLSRPNGPDRGCDCPYPFTVFKGNAGDGHKARDLLLSLVFGCFSPSFVARFLTFGEEGSELLPGGCIRHREPISGPARERRWAKLSHRIRPDSIGMHLTDPPAFINVCFT